MATAERQPLATMHMLKGRILSLVIERIANFRKEQLHNERVAIVQKPGL